MKKPVYFLEMLVENGIIQAALEKGYVVSCTSIGAKHLYLTLTKDVNNLDSIKFLDIYLRADANGIEAWAKPTALCQSILDEDSKSGILEFKIDIANPQNSLKRIIEIYERNYPTAVARVRYAYSIS